MLKKKMLKRRKELLSSDKQIDPMIYAVNMVDCMLVLAVGFLIFTIMSMSMENVIFNDMTPEQKTELIKTIKQTVQVEMGHELNNNEIQNSSSGTGMTEMRKVYQDPKTGKIIMVKN